MRFLQEGLIQEETFLFRFQNQAKMNLALDVDGHLTYLAANEWRLDFVMEDWPDIEFRKTLEHL
jgi:peptide chain release factor 3